ncbi:MAG: hypothetical protein GQ475_04225 [Methylococcaceae bacterium]|nr:hypothetical protein [Methylococcaceae bacterium]
MALIEKEMAVNKVEHLLKKIHIHMINDNGLKKMQALCAVMRKLLHAIHGMLKANENFDGERFYQFPAEAIKS